MSEMVEDRVIAVWRRVVRFFERLTGPFFEQDGKVITYSEMTPEQRRAFDAVSQQMGATADKMRAFGETLIRNRRGQGESVE